MATMDQKYSDGSNHECCSECGMCVTCGDCKCTHEMLIEDALKVKQWRLEEGLSFRKIALRLDQLSFGTKPIENQRVGRQMCIDAQLILNEYWED